jgi:hypothetical protein
MEVKLHALAPAKPELGASCNGCGACCAMETCPVGRVVFVRRGGPCPALQWHIAMRRYRCGLVDSPGDYLRWLPLWARDLAGRLIARSIAVGSGCDLDARVE